MTTHNAWAPTYQTVKDADGRVVSFRCQPRDPITGRRISITAATEAELLSRLEELQSARRAKRLGRPVAEVRARLVSRVLQPRKVSDWAREWLATRPTRSPAWRHRLAPWFGDRCLVELNRAHLERWEGELRATYAPKSVQDAYAVLSGIARLAIDAGELDRLPWGGWRPAKGQPVRPRQAAGNLGELLALASAAQADDRQAWARGWYSQKAAAVFVLGLTGLRQGEAAGLGWDDVRLTGDSPSITVRWQVREGWRNRYESRPQDPTKGRKVRMVPLHPAAVAALLSIRGELQRRGWYRDDGPVFPGIADTWRSDPEVLKPEAVHRWAKAAGLPHPEAWNVHSLRHSFATLEHAGGASLKELAAKTGHTDMRTLEAYVHELKATGQSRIGEVPAGTLELPPAHEVDEDDDAPPTERQPMRLAPIARQPRDCADWPELAREWLADDGPRRERQPWEITHALRLAYSRGYQRERYRHPEGPRQRWQDAARRVRNATLGAWGKALAEARRALDEAPAPVVIVHR